MSVMTHNPSNFSGNNLPVERVSYADCLKFCGNLEWDEYRSVSGKYYRLPTEAEWEYACRAGTTTQFSFGDTFIANAWGLHDMHGNVGEFCQDSYNDYRKEDVTDPFCEWGLGPVYRGGSYACVASACDSANRFHVFGAPKERATKREDGVGCRVVLCLE